MCLFKEYKQVVTRMPSRADDDESCSSSSDSEDEQATPYPSNGNKGLTLLDDEANTDLVLPPDDRGESEACELSPF